MNSAQTNDDENVVVITRDLLHYLGAMSVIFNACCRRSSTFSVVVPDRRVGGPSALTASRPFLFQTARRRLTPPEAGDRPIGFATVMLSSCRVAVAAQPTSCSREAGSPGVVTI